MANFEFDYNINRYSEKFCKKDGTLLKLSDPFLAAREVSREGGVNNFLNKHYEERRHHEWQQEDPHNNDLTLEEIKELKAIEKAESLGCKSKSIFEVDHK
ncbi:hypothetical protein [Sporosarcina sp. HYO08]|uniref:hypothetical protein n=1 Tax=Sporosarcina sp. HYO08 TaxID=1759557 RepID=UPI0007964DB5|nr:hypothetical protein [Sporosarcina sp. HYO08]KXH86101.1 hypothetical protein AU377_14625 [Sporosarcina sp. HYO08]